VTAKVSKRKNKNDKAKVMNACRIASLDTVSSRPSKGTMIIPSNPIMKK
jgi:hypothetical protein